MDLGLEGKRAFVAGSSSGIGRAVAAGLLAEGAHVVVNDLHADACQQVAEAIAATGGRAVAAAGD
ncbi:MAG: SDR family NAD(P)-dependent oxidoreductase, partial [Polyangia bacterium]